MNTSHGWMRHRNLVTGACAAAAVGGVVLGLTGAVEREKGGATRSPGGTMAVHGRVTGLQGAAGLTIAFVSKSQGTTVVHTLADGSFGAHVSPGVYSVELRVAKYLASTRRQCEVWSDGARCDMVLPDTEIAVSVNEGGVPAAGTVSLYVRGPLSPTDTHVVGFVTSTESRTVTLRGVEFGQFTISAFAHDGRVSVGSATAELSSGHAKSALTLELGHRTLTMRVKDENGSAVKGAVVQSPLRRLDSDEGAFDASKIPGGMFVQVQAPGYLPTCRIVATSGDEQVVTLSRAGPLRSYITLRPNPGRPMGVIGGVPGSECDVDVSGFRLDQTGEKMGDRLRFGIVGLPRGEYVYRARPLAPAMRLASPGVDIEYQVPATCLIC